MAAADARLLKLLSSGKRDGLVSVLRDLIAAGEAAATPPVEKPAKKVKAEKPAKLKKVKAEKPPKAEKAEKAPKAEKPKKEKKAKKVA